MTTNELRACPFCGHEAILVEKRDKTAEGLVSWFCTTCYAQTSNATENGNWNTRPIEDGLRAEIEKLKAVLMDIWHITKEELDEENAILETRGDYMQRLERNINRIETITRKELDKECGQ